MITEDYVSFEIAKLLKKKGFDEVCKTAYETITKKHEVEPCCSSDWGKLNQIKRPTLQMAMKWLREKYNIHIEVRYFPMPNIYRYVIIHSPTTIENIDSHPQYFKTHEEACEAAIKYCSEILFRKFDLSYDTDNLY